MGQTLLSEKLKTDSLLQQLKVKLTNAKREAMANKKFLPPDVLMHMELEIARLKSKSQRLQQLIGEENKKKKGQLRRDYLEYFVDVALSRLSKEEFSAWHLEAKSLSESEAKDGR